MKTVERQREEIIRFGKMLHQCGLVAATDGNLSVRLDDGTFLHPDADEQGLDGRPTTWWWSIPAAAR